MDSCDWKPFLKAAFERNPVSVEYFRKIEMDQIYQIISGWPDESIYQGNGLAMPDEVVNYQRGDGLEKAITLANILKARHISQKIMLEHAEDQLILHADRQKFTFKTGKHLKLDLLKSLS